MYSCIICSCRNVLKYSLSLIHISEGAFYAFPSIESTGLSCDEFAKGLLFSQKVAVVPGTAFGDAGEGHVRISYSYSVGHLTEALRRIGLYLQELGAR